MHLVLADNDPTLAMWGQIAAIVICLFSFIFVVIAVAFNAGMAYGLTWVREKANLLKKLQPVIDTVNKNSEAFVKGVSPSADENPVVRTVASVPSRVHQVDKRVDQGADKVAKAVIELRARTVQAKTVVKAFLMPKRVQREIEGASQVSEEGLQFQSPGYRAQIERQAPEIPVAAAASDGNVQSMEAAQLNNVPSR
jgi:hypothetical protein